MRKSDKKHERELAAALTRVCDMALETVPGFQWITHFVNYNNFPRSLIVVSVFSTDEELQTFFAAKQDELLFSVIKNELHAVGIKISETPGQLRFDTEEACEREHAGNWQSRYR